MDLNYFYIIFTKYKMTDAFKIIFKYVIQYYTYYIII